MSKSEDIVRDENIKAGVVLLDLKDLKIVCLNKDSLVKRLLSLYMEQAPKWIEEFEGAVETSDADRVRKICHTVKGATAAIRAHACVNVIEDLHSMAKEGFDDRIEEKAVEVVSVINVTGELIKRILDLSKSS